MKRSVMTTMGLRRMIFIFLSLALAVDGSQHFHDQYNKVHKIITSFETLFDNFNFYKCYQNFKLKVFMTQY